MKRFNSILNVLRFNSRNWKAVVLCIFAATVFWFFNALNKTYTTNLSFPLYFEYDSENFVPVRSLPQEVRINVTGNGWLLFRRSAGIKIPPLEIPLEHPSETKKIVGTQLPAFFTNQVDGLEINYVLTDTLYVDLQPKTGKWIHLAIDQGKIPLRKGFTIASNVSIMPDSIFVQGPLPVIQALQEPIILSVPFNNIDDDFMEDVEVTLPSSDLIKRDPPTVAVMFNVEQMIRVDDSIRLEIRNVPSSMWPVLGRKRIPVTLAVPENVVNNLVVDSLKAVLDLNHVKRGERKILPTVEGLPQYVNVIRIDSVTVKF